MPDLRVNFAGVPLKNPVIAASGTFGFGREYGTFYDLSELGGICVKGLTLAERAGNPPPRIAETPSGMLNSVGLQNPGVDGFISRELLELRRHNVKIIANVSGNTVEEYGVLCEKLGAVSVDMLELNISCPNVKEGGIAFGTSPSAAAAVTAAAKRSASNIPVMVKLSPNVTDIVSIAKAVEDAGADAISMINTLLGMRIDIHTRRPVLRNNTGGLSGPAILPVAIRMVHQVRQAVSLPILGMGGIVTGDDAVEFLLAGANAVAVGSASFQNPYTPIEVRNGIAAYMERYKISKVTALTNGVQIWDEH
jgi:dihydroorotate dehydrogenase (NAD+) catalytic subunit